MSRLKTGFSIVELITVIGIGALVLASVSFITGRSLSVSRQQVVQVRATEDARLHLQRIAGVIRSARPVDCNNDGYTNQKGEYWLQNSATNELSILVDIDTDGEVELVRYYIPTAALGNTNELHQAITEATSPCFFPATPTSDRILLQSLDNGNTPLFRYFSGPDDASDELTPNQAQTINTSVTRVRPQIIVSLTEGQAEADTDLVTDVTPRAIPCLPSECTPLPTEPLPLIAFEAWPAADPDARGTDISVGDGTNIVLSWSAQHCDDTPVAANDHGETQWDGDLSGGQHTLGPLALSTPNRQYSVSCSNTYGSMTATVDITVVGSPSVTLTSSSGTPVVDASGNPGRHIADQASFTLNWTVSDCDGTPLASNNSADAGFVSSFVGWDGTPEASGSTYSFPARTSPAHHPAVYFTLECTSSLGVKATAVLFVSDYNPVTPPPQITITGEYLGQPVTSNTVVNLYGEVDITWTSSNCTNGELTPTHSNSGSPWLTVNPKNSAGTYAHTQRTIGVLPVFGLECAGVGGATARAALSFKTPPRPTFSGCRQEGYGWRSMDGGCAYMPASLVWFHSGGSEAGDRISCSGTFGDRSDWQIPGSDQILTLMELYNTSPQKTLTDLLHVAAYPDTFWWSRDRVGTAHYVTNVKTRVESQLEPIASNFASLACVAGLRVGNIWEISAIGPFGTVVGDWSRITVPVGQSFAISWRATPACKTLHTSGPTDLVNDWNITNAQPTVGGTRSIRVQSTAGLGSYILRCLDATGAELHRARIIARPTT